MLWEKLKPELIYTNLDIHTSDEVFEILGGELQKQGYCKDSYVEALKKREEEFPTGINMGSMGVAIPHTDVTHVNKKGIAIGISKNPISFVEMGTDDDMLEVKIIFMLAVDEKGHLELLQTILGVLQDPNVLNQLLAAKTQEEIIKIIKEKENN